MAPNAAPRAAAAAAAERQQPASELDAGRPRQGQGRASEPLEPLEVVGADDLAFPYTRAQYVPQAPSPPPFPVPTGQVSSLPSY